VPSQHQTSELISQIGRQACEIIFDRKNEKKSVTITPQYDPATNAPGLASSLVRGFTRCSNPTPWAQVKDVCAKDGQHF